ncbi:serine aminopeptidase S33 family [Nonlabens dokdonensis]|uniref:Serine aminopeptidase S33 family n=2 Tax=Nonlabens dokdonensis TaxID=328515 RepID=A0ABX5Q1Z3_9FLAO|nr:alpha/beta hydrolase [Nonlabens dokdonensis]AGC76432.1 putative hydrolase [Nonlabens dokdonensis DSW-6]PZX44089.1 serine aminopeptidase S33 family [Nonlabens dokdonensis]
MKKLLTFVLNKTANLAPSWNGKLAFSLLCKVQRIEISHKGNEFLDAATETKLNHDKYEATVYRYGNGSKNLIFLHGWLSNSERWRETIQAIDLEVYSCYLVDAPGHGRSKGNNLNLEIYRIFLTDLLKSLGTAHAVIGHSLGSLVTAYTYLEDPRLPIDRYVITGAPAGMNSIYVFFKRIMHLNDKVIANMDSYINRNITLVNANEINISNFLKEVKQPVLVIHDHDDKVCPITYIETAVAYNEDVITFFTSGLGHNLLDKKVIDRTIGFLDHA